MDLTTARSFINGDWVKTTQRKKDIINPYTNEKIGVQWLATKKDVKRALDHASLNIDKVAAIPSYKRAEILTKIANHLHNEKQMLATVLSKETGKPIKSAQVEINRAVETLKRSSEEVNRLFGETIPGDISKRGENTIAHTYRVPVGIVAAITPFNAPLNLICHKLGPSFAAGNITIVKPSPHSTLIAAAFLHILLKAGFPKDAIHLLYGGADIGEYIVKDDRVSVISFTGGINASKRIAQIAGLKKQLYELGGNAATIVHDDANIYDAARQCALTGYSNAGQSCISVQRIYVQTNILQSFTEAFISEVKKLNIGDPLHPKTDVGPVINEATANRIMNWIDEAKQNGAEILYGGKKQGATIIPTILKNPSKQSKVVCEEVFGPIVNIIPYKTIEEAISEANHSPFGLQVGLFTNKIDFAYKVSQQMKTGGIIINGTSNFRLDHLPHGGIKNSGIGREGPRFTIKEMTELKMVVLKMK